MGRIAELLEHPGELASYTGHALARRPKSSIGGFIFLGIIVAAVLWMWPEIERYMKIRRM